MTVKHRFAAGTFLGLALACGPVVDPSAAPIGNSGTTGDGNGGAATGNGEDDGDTAGGGVTTGNGGETDHGGTTASADGDDDGNPTGSGETTGGDDSDATGSGGTTGHGQHETTGSSDETGSTGGDGVDYDLSDREGNCLAVGVVDPEYDDSWPSAVTQPSSHTIDTVHMEPSYDESYDGLDMRIVSFGDEYALSDGSIWESGAGSAQYGTMWLDHITQGGNSISYHMTSDILIVRRTDYNSGNDSANFRFETLPELTLVAEYGSNVATLSTEVLVAMDQPANYVDERFHYLSAPLCSAVQLTVSYELLDGAVFDEETFSAPFDFFSVAAFDLTDF